MHIRQRSGWVSTHFEFSEDVLNYTHRTMDMLRSRAISYASIELEERSTLIRQHRLAFIVGFSLVVAGLVFLVGQVAEPYSILMVLAGGTSALFGYRKTRYVVVEVERSEPIYLLADSHLDQIVDEINTRRKHLWHRLYAEYDPLADPRDELRKFEWLLERNVISAEDFEWVRSEIEIAQRGLEPGDLN